MNNEVEEFLRRAAQRRAQVEAQLRAQAEARARGQGQPPPRPEPPKRLTPNTQSISQQQAPQQAEVVERTSELEAAGNRVSASVAEHMRHSQDIAAHVELLGDRVEVADDEMEAHLQQVFDHSVGRLRKTTESASTPGRAAIPSEAAVVTRDSSPAHGIAELLRNPQSVRNAILLAEVINRPADRW
jgi:hypothetical protein